ncbi:544_t:CDS:10 [Racocetra fulgida]|uniref:544_t:CDS:1 n=1 Tax=Racocetra fulgida TaxID=60492 RepID=A0A9N9G928_9GLOM|nr:544_t:CDS:10 [Racocetra fulgida]
MSEEIEVQTFEEDEVEELLSQQIHFEISEGHVRCLRLSSDQLTLIVGVEGGRVLFYDVTKFASEQAESKPFQIMSFPDDVKDIRPNPGEKHSLIAILLVSGIVYIKDYLLNNEISKIEGNKLIQFTPEGTSKAIIQPPPDLQQQSHCVIMFFSPFHIWVYDSKVQNVLWPETTLLVVAYFPVIQEEDSELEIFVISREIKSKFLYMKCPLICTQSDRPKLPYLYMETVKDWGTNLKCLIICASANSADINLIAQDASNNWTSLILSETNRAALPLSEIHDSDTLPVGLAIDFTCTEHWVTRLTGDEDTVVPPVPLLYILNDECDIIAYRCFHKDENFSGMAPPKVLPTTGHSSEALPPKQDSTAIAQNCTAPSPAVIPVKTESPIIAPIKTASPIVVPIKTASPVVAPIKTASPVVAPIKTASPIIAPIKTASPIVAPIKTASPIIVPTKTEPSTSSLASIASYDKNFLSPKKIISSPPVYTQSRNLGSTQQLTSTETDLKTPHMIRLNATENEINDLHNRIEDMGNNYIAKYHDRTTEQYLDNLDSLETLSIGDLPIITSEINRLENEASSMTQALVDLRNQVNEYSHDVRIDIQHLMCTPSNMINVGRRGILQSRIKERLETTFKTVKESAQALETQLNALHEQIQEKKSNKSIRQISSGDDTSNRETFVSHTINRTEPNKTYTKNISYSVDAAKATAAYLNKERICEKLKNINKFNRKGPVKNSIFEENEDEFIERKSMSPIIISPKKSPSALKPRAFSPTQIHPTHESKPYRSRTTITSPLRKSVYPSEPSSDYQFQPKAMYDTPIRSNISYQTENVEDSTEKYQDYEDRRPFLHDDIYSLPENLGIQETDHAAEVSSSIKFQEPIEIEAESSLSYGDKTVESDELNLYRVSPKFIPTFISKDSETTQESSTLETTPSYQGKEEVQYSDSYRDETQDSVESKIVAPDVSGLSKASELKQAYDHFEEDSKSGALQLVPDTIEEDKNSNELMGVSENFGSFGLGEPSGTNNASGSQGSFGLFGDRSLISTSTSIPPAFGKQTFGTATSAPIVFGAGLQLGGNATGIPPAFATQPSNVNTFSSLSANSPQAFGQPSFGQTGFGQSSLGAPKAQAFGQPAFGQPAFGQHGFGQTRTFGTPSALSANLKPPSGGGFARFAR